MKNLSTLKITPIIISILEKEECKIVNEGNNYRLDIEIKNSVNEIYGAFNLLIIDVVENNINLSIHQYRKDASINHSLIEDLVKHIYTILGNDISGFGMPKEGIQLYNESILFYKEWEYFHKENEFAMIVSYDQKDCYFFYCNYELVEPDLLPKLRKFLGNRDSSSIS